MPAGRYQDEAPGSARSSWGYCVQGYRQCVRFLSASLLSANLDNTFVGTVKHILRVDGLRGLYRGLGPTVLGYLPTWAIYFAVYDSIKTRFGDTPLGISDPPPNSKAHIYPAPQVKGYQPVVREHPWGLHILSAMAAGASSTVCTNPLWVIKTRFQVRVHALPVPMTFVT